MEKKPGNYVTRIKGYFTSKKQDATIGSQPPAFVEELSTEEKEIKEKYESYKNNYSEKSLKEKVRSISSKVGNKAIESILWLWVAAKHVDPMRKSLIYGVLGYLILPLDLIPDILPGGFVDDMAAIASIIASLATLSPETKAQIGAEVSIEKEKLFPTKQ